MKNPFFQLVILKYVTWYKANSAALWGRLPRTLAVKPWYPTRLWSACGVGKHSHLALSRKGRGTAVAVGTQSAGTQIFSSACRPSTSYSLQHDPTQSPLNLNNYYECHYQCCSLDHLPSFFIEIDWKHGDRKRCYVHSLSSPARESCPVPVIIFIWDSDLDSEKLGPCRESTLLQDKLLNTQLERGIKYGEESYQ